MRPVICTTLTLAGVDTIFVGIGTGGSTPLDIAYGHVEELLTWAVKQGMIQGAASVRHQPEESVAFVVWRRNIFHLMVFTQKIICQFLIT